jgi:hypothetical protein
MELAIALIVLVVGVILERTKRPVERVRVRADRRR